MCGIAGVLSPDGSPDQLGLVEAIVATQRSRGPDRQATVVIRSGGMQVALGHSRLMVLDLAPDAPQPLWDHDGRHCVVCDGEVYNHAELRSELNSLGHRFVTQGDAEVILEAFKAWGVDAFERLDGVFAFGLWDHGAGRLYLVRDRFGVKPLYCLEDSGRLCFASTCEGLARQMGLAPDLGYATRGIRYWVYDDDERSPYEGLRALRPGHYALATVGPARRITLAIHPFYSLSERVARKADELRANREDQVRDELAALLERSITRRMRPDMPIGVSLSGGLDSSVLASRSSAQGRVVGLTFGHPDDVASEGPMVRGLARHIGLEVQFVRPNMREVVDAYFAAVEAQGAPFPTASIVGQYCVYRAAHRAGLKVLFSGQGSDEIFMGYRKFQAFHLRQLLNRHEWSKTATLLLASWPEIVADLPRAATYLRARRRYTRTSGIASALRLPDAESITMQADPARPLWLRQVQDIEHTSLPALLRYEDRNSMAHGVEGRLPYLDSALVEFALALEVTYKLREGMRKWIMRDYARGLIPEAIRTSRFKRGFDVAQNRWIEGGLGQAIRTALHDRLPQIRQFIAPDARIERLFSDARLKHEASAFSEATTLMWLGNCALRARALA